MSYSHMLTDDQRRTLGLCLAEVRNVAHKEVLDIAAVPDFDPVDVAADHRVAPYGAIAAGTNVADYPGRIMYEIEFTQYGKSVEIGAQLHDGFPG